jgi:hypothetical protein
VNLPNPLRAWLRAVFTPKPKSPARRTRPKLLRGLEALESREVPSTWTRLTYQPPTQNATTLVLLSDGQVMAHDTSFANPTWFTLSPDGNGNYANGTWTTAAPMNHGRGDFPSNVLPSGNLFVLSGEKGDDGSGGEIYDSAANTWTETAMLPPGNAGIGGNGGSVPTTLLPNNKIPFGTTTTNQAWLFDSNHPNSNTAWKPTTPKLDGDNSGEEGSVLLPDQSVLYYSAWADQSTSPAHFQAERYYGSTGAWQDASQPADPQNLPLALAYGNKEIGAPLLLPPSQNHPQGGVFWIGGNNHTAFLDLQSGTWTRTHDLPTGVIGDDQPAALLPDGNVLLSGAFTQSSMPTDFVWEYNPLADQFFQQATNNGPATGLAPIDVVPAWGMLDLPNGHALMSFSGKIWDFDPGDSPVPQYRPVVASVDPTPNPDGSYKLHGLDLTGFSEGAAFGDDAEMSTNFPIVKLTLGNRVWYAKTHDWTPGVQDSDPSHTVNFDLPPTLPAGTFSLQVVASGIASDPFSFTTTTGPIYADSRWAGMSGLVDPDPLAPGAAQRLIGTDCFATVSAAISAAAGTGRWVIVNGDAGPTGSGDFSQDDVALDIPVNLYVQNGAATFGTFPGTAPAADIVLNGATVRTDAAVGGSEYRGLISGHGGLTKTDPNRHYSNLTLSGAANIDSPSITLDVDGGGLALSGPIGGVGDVSVNSGEPSLTGAINLIGHIAVNSGGTLRIASASIFAGNTVVVSPGGNLDFGTVTATFGGLAGAGAVNLGATTQTAVALTVGGDGESTIFSGSVTGVGPLIKTGPSSLTMTGIGNSAPVTVAGGSVRLDPANPNALQNCKVTVNVDGGLDLRGVSAANVGDLEGGAAVVLGGALNVDGSVGPPVALTIGSNNSSPTFSGTLTGTGSLTKEGTGTLTLTGADGALMGTTVSGGELVVRGTLDNQMSQTITVAAGAALRGDGFADDTVNLAGTLAPGSSDGTGVLTISRLNQPSSTGPWTFSARLGGTSPGPGPGGYDQAVVRQDVYLTGASLNLALTAGFIPNPGQTFDLISSTIGHIHGTFANLPNGAVLSTGSRYFTITFPNQKDAILTAIAPPKIANVQINDGSAQRSEVDSITVTFSEGVTFSGGNAATAFQLQHVQNGVNVQNLQPAVSTDSHGRTVVTLTFTTTGNAATEVDPISILGTGGDPNRTVSLADGRFQLTVLSSHVTDSNNLNLAGDGATAGTDYINPPDTYQGNGLHLYRLFGDVSGDGTVDATDVGQLKSCFNTGIGNPAYQWWLDAQNDGAIDPQDVSYFKARFNTNVF